MRCLVLVAIVFAAACGAGEARQGLESGEPVAAPARGVAELAIVRVITGNPPRRDIVAVDGGGRNMRVVARGGLPFLSRPTWSPEGTKLAFARIGGSEWRGEQSDIFVVDAAKRHSRRLTTTGRAFAPVWTPDGRTIVFAERATGPPHGPTAGLWAMTSDGRNRRPLLEAEAGRIDIPSSFSPDGTKLTLTRCTWREPGEGGRVDNACGVYLLDVRSLDLRRLVERAADAVFSPDGERIAYVTDRDENGDISYGDRVFYANELYVMNADGSDPHRITRTRDLNERAPSWSFDGRLIAYQRGKVTGNAEGTMVVTIRADGSCARLVAFERRLAVWYGSPAWRPGAPSAERCR